MLQELRSKVAARGLSERLRTERASLGEWARHSRTSDGETWEAGFSTYGALNCEPDLRAVSARLHDVLASHAPFVAGVLNRWALFELAADASTGQWRRMTARARATLPGARALVWTSIPTPLRRCNGWFEPGSTVRGIEAAGLPAPPDRVRWTDPFREHWGRSSPGTVVGAGAGHGTGRGGTLSSHSNGTAGPRWKTSTPVRSRTRCRREHLRGDGVYLPPASRRREHDAPMDLRASHGEGATRTSGGRRRLHDETLLLPPVHQPSVDVGVKRVRVRKTAWSPVPVQHAGDARLIAELYPDGIAT